MREAIGGTWFFQLMIVFILLFVSYLAVSINYTKSFRVKNEVLSFIEREEGFTDRTNPDYGTKQLINEFLKNTGYGAQGKCEEGWLGFTDLSTDSIPEKVDKAKKYYYCIKRVSTKTNSKGVIKIAHYEIRVFFEFNLPVFGDLFTFKIDGTTGDVHNPADSKFWNKYI